MPHPSTRPDGIAALRAREFPWAGTDGAIYLNTASTGPLPARGLEAVTRLNTLRAAPHRLPKELEWGTLDRAREIAARLVGADVAEIALAPNTSTGLNLAAMALPLVPGDVVLTPEREFPANVYPWRLAASRRGVEHRFVPVRDGMIDEESLLAALDQPRVRVLAVSWVSFVTGARLDLARLGAACRARGIWFVVDAIQGLGPCTLDVRACAIDVLACGAQKWLLSPWGTGFTYVRRELVESIEPHVAGWLALEGTEDLARLLDYATTWRASARRFEVNTHPAQDFAGFVASADLLLEVGLQEVAAHVSALVRQLLAGVAEQRGMRIVTPNDPARHAGIVTVVPPDLPGAMARLDAGGVAYAVREGAVRLAPYLHNTSDDIAQVLALLADDR